MFFKITHHHLWIHNRLLFFSPCHSMFWNWPFKSTSGIRSTEAERSLLSDHMLYLQATTAGLLPVCCSHKNLQILRIESKLILTPAQVCGLKFKLGAYNRTYSSAPPQPEKDLPRRGSATDRHSKVDANVHQRRCLNFNVWMNVPYKHWHVQTLAADLWIGIADE